MKRKNPTYGEDSSSLHERVAVMAKLDAGINNIRFRWIESLGSKLDDMTWTVGRLLLENDVLKISHYTTPTNYRYAPVHVYCNGLIEDLFGMGKWEFILPTEQNDTSKQCG